MKLGGVKAGDIVRVDGSLAMVLGKLPGKLLVSWVRGGKHSSDSVRTITARAVETHWAKRGG